jgi:hypothetical protein
MLRTGRRPGARFGAAIWPSGPLARMCSSAEVPATYMAAVPRPCRVGGSRRTMTDVERGMMNESSVYSEQR